MVPVPLLAGRVCNRPSLFLPPLLWVRMGSQGSPVKSYDYLLKFLLVGDSDVGKGEILDSLQDGSAESPYAYSSGESLCSLSCWLHSLAVMIFVRRGSRLLITEVLNMQGIFHTCLS